MQASQMSIRDRIIVIAVFLNSVKYTWITEFYRTNGIFQNLR